MKTHSIEEIVEEIKSLEPLPEVAQRVLELASSEDVVPRDLVALIQTDAPITAKILKLCNSAYYGFQREIASLSEAGNLLGVSTLTNLVLTSCAGRYFRDYGRMDPDLALRRWESSVATALAASLLAGMDGGVDRNRAYTVGLLQNVGHLVMDRFLPERLAALREAVAGGASLMEAEEEVFGMHHAEIGARLTERWSFPEVLVDAIRHHHAPERAEIDPVLASVAHLAEMVSASMEMGEGLEGLAYDLKGSALGLCGIDRVGFEAIEETLSLELDKARELVELA